MNRVTVADLDISFFNLVWLMIKISFASIPAMIVVSAVLWTLALAGIMLLGVFGFALGGAT